jgi:CRP/FNR family transcriptional regulator, cyclic AMP receptor protein
LRQIPLFRNCDAVPLQVLAFAAERQEFAVGKTIIKEGQKAVAAYFVMSGSADLEQGRHKLGHAEAGSLLGELAMIAGSTYSITAVASQPVTAARIDHELFKRVADEYPEFGRAVLGALSEKLGASVRELDNVRGLLVKAKGFSNLL